MLFSVKKKYFLCAVVSLLMGVLVVNNNTYAAAITGEPWELKALAEGIWKCYYARTKNNDYVITSGIVLDDMSSYTDLIASTNENFVPLINGGGGSGLNKKIKINDAGLSCRQLFNGYNGAVQDFPSLLETKDNKTILSKMGYKKDPAAEQMTGKCFKVDYFYKEEDIRGVDISKGMGSSNEVCTKDGTMDTITVNGESTYKSLIQFVKNNNKLLIKQGVFKKKEYDLSNYGSFTDLRQAISTYLTSELFTTSYSDDKTVDVDFRGKNHCAKNPLKTVNGCLDVLNNFMVPYDYKEALSVKYTFGGYTDVTDIDLDGRREAALSAINSLVGFDATNYDSLKYNPTDRNMLYYYYLTHYYEAEINCSWEGNDNLTKESLESSGFSFVEQTKNGKTTSCAVIAHKNNDKKVHTLNSEMHFSDTEMSFMDIVKDYDGDPSNKNVDELVESIKGNNKPWNSSGDDDSGSGAGSGSRGNCWESGLEAMAWVMCPAENNLKNFANGIWGVVENWLQVDNSLYGNTFRNSKDEETETPARVAWGYVRTIANVAMIVFLGIIVFSQLTGYGIDNYGIKKLLPKFIVMAILINLSFLICQLAIDLSNIIGNGIQGLFYGIGNNVISAVGADVSLVSKQGFIEVITKAIYAIGTVGAGAVGTALTFYTVASSGGGVVLAVILVFLMLLVIVAAVLMFFVSLGARTVIILLCAILSPLAFVCYILPNTKPVYKKWYDAFKAALIVYPICGFTIGLSYIVKAIVLTQESPIWMIVVSGIMPYLAFFMIPALLKAAISATGTIGAALTSMGGTFKNGVGKLSSTASNAVKDSNAYKMATAERTRQRQASFAMRTKARLDKREKNGKELSPTQQRMRAYAEHTLDKQNAEDVAALQSSFAKKYAKDENLDNIGGALTEALQNHKEGDVQSANRIKALSNLMAARGGKSAAGDIAKAIDKAHLAAGSSAYGVLRDNLSENRDLGSMLKEKRGSMFDNIQKLGGGSIAQSINKGSLNDLKDWATQGAAEVQQATSSFSYGPLTEEQQQARDRYREIIKNMLNSSDPTIQTNVLKNTDKLTAWIDAANALGVDVPTQYVSANSNGEIAREGEIRVIQHGQEYLDQQQQYNSARSNGNGSSANNGGSSS